MPLYRAFKPEFVRHMTSRGGWPSIKNTQSALAQRGAAIRTDYYIDLKRGAARDEKNPLNFLRAVLTIPDDATPKRIDPLLHSRANLLSFAGVREPAELTNLSDEQLFAIYCEPPQKFPSPPREEKDWLQMGYEILSTAVHLYRRIDENVQACADEGEVRAAVHWMYVSHGRNLSENPILAVDAAFQLAESHIQIPLSDYQKGAIEWWRFNPWTVVTIRGRRKPNGVSIMLPARAETFDRIMQGNLMTSECRAADLFTPTSMIIVEACAERPVELGGEPINSTIVMFLAQLAQVGALSRCDLLDRRIPLRLLAIAPSPLARRRLLAHKFKETGVKMPKVGVDLMLRTMRQRLRDGTDYLTTSYMRGFAGELDSPPEL